MTTKNTLTASLIGAGIIFSASSFAQQEQGEYLKPALESATEITDSAAKSQQKINNITDQIDQKLQQFKTINKEIDGLNTYNEQLKKQLNNQQQEMLDLNTSIDEVSVIERQIMPLMIRMIEGLEQFVALDVPFLVEERAQRISALKTMMDKADIAPSEKFRRVMEAFQVEMDYGRTLEAYSGLHEIDGQERDVDFLRVGRTVLIYQTRDASLQGSWNKKIGQWEELPSSFRTHVTKGLRMAKKQLAPDLLMLPVAMTD